MPRQDLAEQGRDTRKRIKRFVKDYTRRYGVPPALTEIADGVGLASHNAVRNHLVRMRDAGEVNWQDGKFRTLRVLEKKKR